jgi:type IV pilus assembly protein PilQ
MRLVVMTLLLVVMSAASARAQAPPRAPRPTLTLDVQDAEIDNVIRLLADVGGVNVVFGAEVQGKVTVKLKQVRWDTALRVVLQSKDLGMVRDGNVLRVAPQADLDAEALAALERSAAQQTRGPLTTRVVPVNNASAKELAAIVKAMLSPRGSVSVDERTNTLIIRDVRGSGALAP